MKAQNVCIRFNRVKAGVSTCPEKGAHKVGQAGNEVTLRHICAGCLKKSNTQEAHPCQNCANGPFKALFRGW